MLFHSLALSQCLSQNIKNEMKNEMLKFDVSHSANYETLNFSVILHSKDSRPNSEIIPAM